MQTTVLEKVKGGVAYRGYKGKGGGSARQPVEAPDSLHSVSYANVLDMLSEGPIEGLVNGLQSVYLDGTPVQNENGTLNFDGVKFDFRNGTQDQDYIPGFPAAQNTVGIGVTLVYGTPWTRAVSRKELSALRLTVGVNGLSKANTSNGDINGYRVAYEVDLQTAGGPWKTVISSAFSGKTTQQYRRSHRIELPFSVTGWAVRVRRLTPNANSATIADTTVIESITEIVDAKFRYPMTALAGIQLDASQFQSIPTRAFHIRGRIIKVPANYDPTTRTYTGTWNGVFKTAYTNNPAWVFYDLVTNDRYGLGNHIPASWVNKWALYQIAQYCDESVPDGRGGTEPRFTCNLYLQEKAEAYKVLQDLCSIFRGMVYWSAGTAVPVADMPVNDKDVVTYTQANVIDGQFTYSGTRRKDRATVAIVSYNDMTDFGRAKVVYWQDDEAVARYGVRKVELTAFGCTSESQALRLAKWVLLTAKRETRSVTFSVGLDGTLVAPGSIIRIADNLFAGKRIGGRVVSATTNEIILDGDLKTYLEDKLTITLPDGTTESRTVKVEGANYFTIDSTEYSADTTKLTADKITVEGSSTLVTVDPPFTQAPAPESVWTLESSTLKTQLFRVISVAESGGIIFEISAVQHEPGKFSAIDFDTKLDNRPVIVAPPKVQPAPTNVKITSTEVLSQGVASTTVTFSWDSAQDAIYYELQWKRDDSDWVSVPRTQATSLELPNAYRGVYVARVRAINSIATPSAWVTSLPVMIEGATPAPPKILSFFLKPIVFGIEVTWGFEQGLYTAEYTEVRYGITSDFAQSLPLSNYAYPQNTATLTGLKAGVTRYFWARIVDKFGTPGPWSEVQEGVSSSDASDILDYIGGQISETDLSQSLREEIASGGGAQVAVEEVRAELAAMYTMKVQLNANGAYHLAGIGIGVENNAGVMQSQVLVTADRFAILPATTSNVASAASPFTVENGQVFMREAFIKNASIGSAKIADWLESDAKGPNGLPVFRANMRTGQYEFNSAVSGEGRLLINNNYVRVYDAQDRLRVELGKLA